MNHKFRFTAEKIGKRIELVRPLIRERSVPLAPFSLERLPDATAKPGSGENCGEVAWGSYWAGQDTHFVLRSQFSVPKDFTAPALFLPLGVAGDIFTHPEALLHIDDQLVASADRHHQLVSLKPGLADGSTHSLMLHGWTGLTGWPPDPNNPSRLQILPCFVVDIDEDLREFVTLAEVALDVATSLDENDRLQDRLLTALDAAFVRLDTRDPLEEEFRASVRPALAELRTQIDAAGPPTDETLWAIGHAHMDVAYLWPVSQIRQKNGRTYSNVLRLMEAHPDFHFSHSQPQLYAYTEEDFPDIFDSIRDRVAEGRWEVMGGMWVESDCNIPGGEALARQMILGRRYFADRFGDVETPVLWLPDTFGFPWSLPQLMKQAGLEYFVTNKLNWNQYNQMPSSSTWWQGLDGSRVLAQFLTTPREVQHLPFPTNYKSDLSAAEVMGTVSNATTGDSVEDFIIAFGYGDGGGGPTDELVMKAKTFGAMPGAPQLRMGTVASALAAMAKKAADLPDWNDEFYLEGHRGTLTSQAWIKRANRQAERALHDAEAALVTAYPKGVSQDIRDRLVALWQRLCLNQFHDILTGTSVPVVFEEARADYEWIMEGANDLLNAALAHLGADGGQGVFNPAPVESDPVALLPEPDRGAQGQKVDGGRLVAIGPVPAYGFAAADVGPALQEVSAHPQTDGIVLNNGILEVTVGHDGLLHSVVHLPTGRETMAEGETGNQFWAYEDRPLSWDAWDIDVFHTDRSEKITDVTDVSIIEDGPLRAAVQVTYKYRSSEIVQIIRLIAGSPRLEFVTQVDWQEQHILLKTIFPVEVLSPRATYDIQWGQIERPTHRNTSWDYAKFEVPAQKWADLSEGGFGVALLNDCKHGYDIRKNLLRLTLIKSSTIPDPYADLGRHDFTYALLPHAGDLALVRAEARRLNDPVIEVSAAAIREPLVSCGATNIVLETLKPADDGRGFILRLYESARQRGPVIINFARPMAKVYQCDLLENDLTEASAMGDTVSLSLNPFQIVSIRCIPE